MVGSNTFLNHSSVLSETTAFLNPEFTGSSASLKGTATECLDSGFPSETNYLPVHNYSISAFFQFPEPTELFSN